MQAGCILNWFCQFSWLCPPGTPCISPCCPRNSLDATLPSLSITQALCHLPSLPPYSGCSVCGPIAFQREGSLSEKPRPTTRYLEKRPVGKGRQTISGIDQLRTRNAEPFTMTRIYRGKGHYEENARSHPLHPLARRDVQEDFLAPLEMR